MSIRLFVGNLPYQVTEAELRELFSSVGPLAYLSLPTDRESGKQRGFAFVEFDDRAQADEAIRRFNHQLFKGRPLAVNEARARENRSPSGAPTRSSSPQFPSTPEPEVSTPPASSGKPSRNFGPDAIPQRRRNKGKAGPKSERAAKGPMRERVRGQFFGGNEDDPDDEEVSEERLTKREDEMPSEDEQ